MVVASVVLGMLNSIGLSLSYFISSRSCLFCIPCSPRSDGYLSGRTLTGTGLNDLSEKDLVDVFGVEINLGERMLDYGTPELRGRQRGKSTVERSDRRPGGSYDVDGRLLSDGTGL